MQAKRKTETALNVDYARAVIAYHVSVIIPTQQADRREDDNSI
jgi:hypothetical protein